MDQTELTIKEVIVVLVEDALLPEAAHELGPLGSGHECERGACFQGAQDPDKPLIDPLVPDEVVSPLVLAKPASAILVSAAGLLRPGLGV